MRLIGEALTFDDVTLVPAYSEILPRDVNLKTQVTSELSLNMPLMSAAMDTVTEARLAIAVAQEGGIGVVHKNMSPLRQAEQVRMVKKYEAGVIKDPITVSPQTTIREVLEITHRHNISGVPVVDGDELVGIVTGRDMRLERKMEAPVRNIMTHQDKLVTEQENAIQAVIDDMQSARTMDRIVCGDVGLGTTEVSMRATFIEAHSGRQVAVLVPTT